MPAGKVQREGGPEQLSVRCMHRGCTAGPWDGQGGWPAAAGHRHARSSGHRVRVKLERQYDYVQAPVQA